MNQDLNKLHPYPFEKLRALFGNAAPAREYSPIALSIGEPKHASPEFVTKCLSDSLDQLAKYPLTKGLPELRTAIAHWANRRFGLHNAPLDAESQVLPVNGTREALFAFAQAVIDRENQPLVVSPNPFYQIYEGAALLAGAEPYFVACTQDTGFLPAFEQVPDSVWQRCQLVYLCSPGNPTGAVMPFEQLKFIIDKADEFDFIIASDECYSELYFDEDSPPIGLLEACARLGRTDYKRCVVFHSLSKRSNLPGLRSGFVAGDAEVMSAFLKYRTYHGCAMPVHSQLTSIAAWNDEQHVHENRRLYKLKFDRVLSILGDVLTVQKPDAGFYLWPETPLDDTRFSLELYKQKHITVLPGQYLSRTVKGRNPGQNRVRMALVATLDECEEAALRIRDFVEQLQ